MISHTRRYQAQILCAAIQCVSSSRAVYIKAKLFPLAIDDQPAAKMLLGNETNTGDFRTGDAVNTGQTELVGVETVLAVESRVTNVKPAFLDPKLEV